MGSLYRKRRNGKAYGFYIAKWRDGDGLVRTQSTGCRDRSAARNKLSELERRAERQRAGVLTALEALAGDWATVPVTEHIDDWVKALKGRGRTPRHARDMEYKLTRIASELCFARLSELSRPRLEAWLGDRYGEGMPARTLNGYAGAAVAFGNWLLKAGRMTVNPFGGIDKRNERADRRHVRRALTPEELALLLEATETRPVRDMTIISYGPNEGKPRQKVSKEAVEKARRLGQERSLFYRTLAYTGLRLNEARTLRICDLLLDPVRPCINIRAENEKNRQGGRVPLRADLAGMLRAYLAELRQWQREEALKSNRGKKVHPAGDGLVFPNAPTSVRVFDRDLVAAGLAKAYKADGKTVIEKTDASGRTLDIHCLRGTFASMLAAAGVPLATAQVLMRHSTPTLTARHYVDPAMLDTAGAVERLPEFEAALPEVAIQSSRAGGNTLSDGATIWAPAGAKAGHSSATHDMKTAKRVSTKRRQTDTRIANVHAPVGVRGCQGKAEKDGSGAGTRTPDTWIMIPLL